MAVTDPQDGLRLAPRFAPVVIVAVMVGFAVAACAVALVVAMLVREYGGGVGPRAAGAVADLCVVVAHAVTARRVLAAGTVAPGRTARAATVAWWTGTIAVALVAAGTLAFA